MLGLVLSNKNGDMAFSDMLYRQVYAGESGVDILDS